MIRSTLISIPSLVLIKSGVLSGLQVGIAASLVSQLQGQQTDEITTLFGRTGFWEEIASDPFSRRDWIDAARRAPAIKADYFTVLSLRDCLPDIERIIATDNRLRACFVD